MRKFLIIAVLLLAGSGRGVAGEPVSISPFPNSDYFVSQSTVSVSSTTATLFSSSNRYRSLSLALDGDSTVLYYWVDGTTTNVSAVGFPFVASTGVTIENNDEIAVQVKAGSTTVILRRIEITK